MRLFSYISEGDIHFPAGEKVIPSKEFVPLMKAKEVLEKAQEDAKKYHEENEELCAKEKEKAIEEGFQEGLNRLNDLILGLEEEIKALKHELHRQVLPLALNAAKKIVGRELKQDPEVIVDIVLQALAPATQNHRITIYVNKNDREILEKERERIASIFQHLEVLTLQTRDDLSDGSCIIETEKGIINAELDNQWRALEAAFERFMKRTS